MTISWRHAWLAFAAVIAASLLWTSYVGAEMPIPRAPTLERPIVDQTSTLSDEQITTLSQQISESRGQKSYQIAVLMVSSIQDDSLEAYSIRVAREWGIGEKDKNNGVLILIAKDDRKMRIEVGSGLEGDLPDARAGRIIRNAMAPKFRKDDYVGGISAAITQIADAVEGKPESVTQSTTSEDWFAWLTAGSLASMFGLAWLASILGRSKSWWAGGIVGGGIGTGATALMGFVPWSFAAIAVGAIAGLGFDYFVSKNYREAATGRRDSPDWWAGGTWGGWGSGGGSGGSGGFGGGGFSGGGSSGSW